MWVGGVFFIVWFGVYDSVLLVVGFWDVGFFSVEFCIVGFLV